MSEIEPNFSKDDNVSKCIGGMGWYEYLEPKESTVKGIKMTGFCQKRKAKKKK